MRFSRIFGQNIKTHHAHLYLGSKSFNKNHDKKIIDEINEEPFKLNIASPPSLDHINNEAAHLEEGSSEEDGGTEDDPAPWRYGPAKFFFDRLDLPPNPKNFEYGTKYLQKHKKSGASYGRRRYTIGDTNSVPPTLTEDNFLAVNLIRWEDNVYMDGNQAKEAFLKDYPNEKLPYSGYIPLKGARTYKAFIQSWKKNTPIDWITREAVKEEVTGNVGSHYYFDSSNPIFPFDNIEIEQGNWEEDIIWDLRDIKPGLVPKLMTLEPEDDPTLIGIRDDIKMDDFDGDESKAADRKDHPFTKKSNLILSQVQMRQKQEEQEQLESTMAQITDRDTFHFSNDDTYQPKTNKQAVIFSGGSTIQHSIPAQNIHRAFFPTYLPPARLRHFHRMPMNKRILRGLHIDREGNIEIYSLSRHIKELEQIRISRSMSDTGFEVFPVREISDLSAKDGNLILFEYSEEHPPLLSQPGMASKIRNYYKRVG